MVTLTEAPDGTHALWLFDHLLETGDAPTMRSRYADHMPGDWLERFYRD
jgi:hypothetical protein